MSLPVFIPLCFECGSHDNPCRCKVVGPTLGFIGGVVAAIIEWPVGAIVWCCNHKAGNRIMGQPFAVIGPSINHAIPI
eukprot:SM000062S19947  [mRNA]  locus=s62:636719:637295:+ [translate_table: standard]